MPSVLRTEDLDVGSSSNSARPTRYPYLCCFLLELTITYDVAWA